MKRNRIIYLLLCIAAIVLASFYGGPVSYSILFGVLLIAPVCLIYLLVVYAFFRIYQIIGIKHITAYEPVPYYFILQNEYLLNFCNISIGMYSTFSYIDGIDPSAKDSSGSGTCYELLPGESVRHDTTLICRYRGDYFIGIKEITIVDFLKLFKVTYKIPEPLNVVVAPRITELDSLRSIPEINMLTSRENTRLSSDLDSTVRDYTPGDPLKGISWKATAKTGKMKSRMTYGEEKQGISLFLDTRRISDDEYTYIPVENKCLEIVLAISNYFSKLSVPVKLFYSQSAPNVAGVSSPGEMEDFHTAVSGIHFRNGEDCCSYLDSLINGTGFSTALLAVLVITSADTELNNKLYALSLSGTNTIIYYVGYAPAAENIMDLPNQRVFMIHPEDDLTKTL